MRGNPTTYITGVGLYNTVGELVEYVFGKLDLDWKEYVGQDPRFYRPEELDALKGDCSKTKNILGWKHNYTFETMLDDMIDSMCEKYGGKL